MFDIVDIWAARTHNTVQLVSANDHVHLPNSLHYEGLAVDLHSSDLNGLAVALRGAGYRVLWQVPGHYGHVHVELTGIKSTDLLASVRGQLGTGLRLTRGQSNTVSP
jgi:hypothetical protein